MMWWGGWNEGMGAWWWVLMGIFWIAVIVFGVWGLSRLFPRGTEPRDPVAVLRSRLAEGEISLQEYEQLSSERDPPKSGRHGPKERQP